ncbi:hypothetical protein KIPB_012349 [Kipferlia bialata]|uniref:Uncharacterized protein n=1 Tax=Kipferlia bialata TaxID=797122 RepID=A0A391NV69_9EUKA|nr:hypothetical protein KIPB_012349 [Kipferlia bialata]|eukprot:g12349.t1
MPSLPPRSAPLPTSTTPAPTHVRGVSVAKGQTDSAEAQSVEPGSPLYYLVERERMESEHWRAVAMHSRGAGERGSSDSGALSQLSERVSSLISALSTLSVARGETPKEGDTAAGGDGDGDGETPANAPSPIPDTDTLSQAALSAEQTRLDILSTLQARREEAIQGVIDGKGPEGTPGESGGSGGDSDAQTLALFEARERARCLQCRVAMLESEVRECMRERGARHEASSAGGMPHKALGATTLKRPSRTDTEGGETREGSRGREREREGGHPGTQGHASGPASKRGGEGRVNRLSLVGGGESRRPTPSNPSPSVPVSVSGLTVSDSIFAASPSTSGILSNRGRERETGRGRAPETPSVSSSFYDIFATQSPGGEGEGREGERERDAGGASQPVVEYLCVDI